MQVWPNGLDGRQVKFGYVFQGPFPAAAELADVSAVLSPLDLKRSPRLLT
jgi:hypothetical protein